MLNYLKIRIPLISDNYIPFIISITKPIGAYVINLCTRLGRATIFLLRAFYIGFKTPLKTKQFLSAVNRIGIESLGIVILANGATGMVFALQGYVGLQRAGGQQLLGALVALAMIRELGPVLTGIMVTARAGSALTAEIGTMRISEQIDALQTLSINPLQYLVFPRICAGMIMLPMLTIFAMACGILGGYLTSIHMLHLSPDDYWHNIRSFVHLSDIMGGLFKSFVFGLILTWIGCYKGYYSQSGARGVGRATTRSVVLSSLMIILFDYFLTKLLEHV